MEHVVRRLGHEPVVWVGNDSDLVGVAAAVVEPGEADGLRVAKRLRGAGVPLVFTSIFPADEAMTVLEPTAYLVKPFPLYVLEAAISKALGVPVQAHVAAAAG
ncbi:MAG TPA: hypothetical protein VGH52_04415 [Gaiellaceae bacterium]